MQGEVIELAPVLFPPGLSAATCRAVRALAGRRKPVRRRPRNRRRPPCWGPSHRPSGEKSDSSLALSAKTRFAQVPPLTGTGPHDELSRPHSQQAPIARNRPSGDQPSTNTLSNSPSIIYYVQDRRQRPSPRAVTCHYGQGGEGDLAVVRRPHGIVHSIENAASQSRRDSARGVNDQQDSARHRESRNVGYGDATPRPVTVQKYLSFSAAPRVRPTGGREGHTRSAARSKGVLLDGLPEHRHPQKKWNRYKKTRRHTTRDRQSMTGTP